MKDTVNGLVLVSMLLLGMFAFYMVGEMREVEIATPETKIDRTIEEEVAVKEAETLEAQILAERAEKEERRTIWYASE